VDLIEGNQAEDNRANKNFFCCDSSLVNRMMTRTKMDGLNGVE
jgi:hypothetical protein